MLDVDYGHDDGWVCMMETVFYRDGIGVSGSSYRMKK
jgi:hypothetical protein